METSPCERLDMEIHYRGENWRGIPLCWSDERLNDAFMATPVIEDVTCVDCLAVYYAPRPDITEPDLMANASFDLWLDGVVIGESIGWKQSVKIDYARLMDDERYAKLVSDHVRNVLRNLAREVEEIGIVTEPYSKESSDED